MPKPIHSDAAPKAIGPYSQGMVHNGFLFASGQLGLIPETGQLAEGIEAQTLQALRNVKAILLAENASPSHVIKTTVFLTNLEHFSVVNAAFETFFQAPYPARSCVEVKALPKNALVEIEVIALLP